MKKKIYGLEEFISFLTQWISKDLIHETEALCGLHPLKKWKQSLGTSCLPFSGWAPLGQTPNPSVLEAPVAGVMAVRGIHSVHCTWYTLSTYLPNFKMNGPLWQILQMKEKLKEEKVAWRICIHIWQKNIKSLRMFSTFIRNLMSRKFP